ncbi:hypothetical protein [Acidocella sp. KAb 2-4]|uniref:hypothetical protein n=1 Tax=Acidocella sp. KAb 2-4 TaxID=2885158 RepID=UPI001D072576|nr:hypothetical protein [Acidocella sp. KAb 2-4]MCB5944219.1 hypothetical protein [Acidocella sp. KAb 2-4]
MPVGFAFGAVFVCWPVKWIIANALLLLKIAVKSGRFDKTVILVVRSSRSGQLALAGSGFRFTGRMPQFKGAISECVR